MKRTTSTTRRTALKYSAATLVGALTTVAGCMGGGGGNDGGGGNGGGNGTTEQTGQPTEAGTAAATPAKTTTGATTTRGGTAGPTMGTTGIGPPTAGPAQAIKLGGKVAGWQGRAPAAIQGETNPTLTLQPGTTYRLTWVNLDGAEHELIIEDSNGKELVASKSSSKKGATRTVTFQAAKQMAQYYCEYHPQSMRGDIRVGSGMGMTGTKTGNATAGSGSGY
jgi:hypothetical protein